eukprot:3764838-Rhodomonas_salina.1
MRRYAAASVADVENRGSRRTSYVTPTSSYAASRTTRKLPISLSTQTMSVSVSIAAYVSASASASASISVHVRASKP